jgi:hemerythrin-like domain-containing protein
LLKYTFAGYDILQPWNICMSRAIEKLKYEHEIILQATSHLNKLLPYVKERAFQKEVTDLLELFKEYIDLCHNRKEEAVLFFELANSGVSKDDSPVGVLAEEHQQERKLLVQMTESFVNKNDYASFTNSSKEYIELIKTHVFKENNLLFPIAENVFSKEKQDDVSKQFEKYEENAVGTGRYKALNEIIAALSNKHMDQ